MRFRIRFCSRRSASDHLE